jgi:hypothetical protein
VLVDFRAKFDFFDVDDLLMLSRLASPLLLLILVFAEIHDPADRRDRRRRDLDEIQSLLLRDGECLRRRHDAELLAIIVYDPNLPNPNALVDPNTIVAPRS